MSPPADVFSRCVCVSSFLEGCNDRAQDAKSRRCCRTFRCGRIFMGFTPLAVFVTIFAQSRPLLLLHLFYATTLSYVTPASVASSGVGGWPPLKSLASWFRSLQEALCLSHRPTDERIACKRCVWCLNSSVLTCGPSRFVCRRREPKSWSPSSDSRTCRHSPTQVVGFKVSIVPPLSLWSGQRRLNLLCLLRIPGIHHRPAFLRLT